MPPARSALLGLVLCLGRASHAQAVHFPRPSISAEPGPVVHRGSPVTFVCRGPPGVDLYRLEKDEGTSRNTVNEKKPLLGETEARFPMASASEDTAGRYGCIYLRGHRWSELSEALELQVTDEGTTQGPHPSQALPSGTPGPPGLRSEQLYVLIGASVAFLLCLLLLVFLLLLYHQHRRKHRTPGSKSKEEKPQERLSPGADVLQRAPGVATADSLPEKDREMGTATPAAGDPQEVTYAQLDHGALTQGAARAASPQPSEPTAESSMYAAVARR